MTVAVDFTIDAPPTVPEDSEPPPGPYAMGAHAIADALEEMVPQPLDLTAGDPPVLESEERAIRWAFARLTKALRENDVATFTSLIHPEYLEQFRSAILEWASQAEAPEPLQHMFGTSDPKALEAMTAAELWTRMGTEVVGLMSAIGRMKPGLPRRGGRGRRHPPRDPAQDDCPAG